MRRRSGSGSAFAPELFKLGLLTEIDRAALAAYCAAYGATHLSWKWRCARNQIRAWSVRGGNAQTLLLRYATEFGMTPASRSRVKAAPPQAADPFEDLLRGRD